jgi:hypothetical protein
MQARLEPFIGIYNFMELLLGKTNSKGALIFGTFYILFRLLSKAVERKTN